jgi:hypothetical protein
MEWIKQSLNAEKYITTQDSRILFLLFTNIELSVL